MQKMAFVLILFFALAIPAAALETDMGFAVQSAAGISPWLAIVETGAGFRFTLTLSDLFSIGSTTGAGYSFLYINDAPRHWFHLFEELNTDFTFLLGTGRRWTHYGSVLPGVYFSIAPGVYMLYGPSFHVRYIMKKDGDITIEPLGLFVRVLWRDTVFSYRWHFQAGLKFSLLL